MRGQAGLISTMIMVGVVLVIGMAALAYFSSSMASQRAELQLRSLLAAESARTVVSVVYGNGTDYVIFLTKKLESANLGIMVLGFSEGGVRYHYLRPVDDYGLYVADPELGVPFYNIGDLSGWLPMNSLTVTARQVYVRDSSGTSPYMRLTDICENLPPNGAVSVGRVSVSPDEPVILRVRLDTDLTIDTAWVMIMLDVGGTYYQIAAVPLPYHS